MSWPINLSKEEILDHIETFQDAPEFIECRNTLLARAVHFKDLQLIECLLKAGAGPDWEDKCGETLMHYLMHEYRAARTTQGPLILEIAEMLLEYGADPNLVGAGNWRALDHCIESQLFEMRDLLIHFGGHPEQREYL